MVEQMQVDLRWAQQHLKLLQQLQPYDRSTVLPTIEALQRSMNRPKFSQPQGFRYQHQGRVAVNLIAQVSPILRDSAGNPIGMIGFYAALPGTAPAVATLHTAVDWLRRQGCQTVIGPIDGDTWHRYRFNLGPHAKSTFLMEPTNPDYYPADWEMAGFRATATYHSKQVSDLPAVVRLSAPAEQRAHSLGYKLRPFVASDFENELRRIYDLSVIAFQGNPFYENMEWSEFLELYSPSRPILHERLVWFALDSDDQPVGFLFCLVDYFAAAKAMGGSRSVWAKLRFLWHKRQARAVNFKSIAVLPEHRRASIGAALMHQGYREAYKMGYRIANLCLIHDDNPSSKLDQEQAKLIRRYALYQYDDRHYLPANHEAKNR
ncbi:MAG: GNAT family N-acetyltransferase [Pirellulaceae bacterium]|nr:GNAT family N-acetyltransferase [Pirellulaceae bacterium]